MIRLMVTLKRIGLLLLLGCWCLGLGWGLDYFQGRSPQALALQQTLIAAAATNPKAPPNNLMVDPVPTRYQPGLDSYLESCGTCHIALPPEVLPTESWKEILRRPEKHFGVSIPDFNRFTQLLIWDYVSTFSRPSPPDAPIPLYVEKSRYFKALHPRVELPSGMTSRTCVTCHPNVANFDFRTLTPEWKDAP